MAIFVVLNIRPNFADYSHYIMLNRAESRADMIEEAVKIHDRFQFEIKLNYEFGNGYSGSAYDVDTYLFIPDSLKINYSTYNKRDFYSDIQTYIRFKTPSVPLSHIADGPDSPLAKLKAVLEKAVAQPDTRSRSDYQHNVKMFCCILKSSLRDYINDITQLGDNKEIEAAISEYITATDEIRQGYRALASLANTEAPDKTIISNFHFADEYIGILIESFTYRLLEALEGNKSIRKKFFPELLKSIKEELEYRKSRKYRSVFREESDNEELVYRMSAFKKYMGSVLYLNTRVQKEGRVVEQLASGLAAGLAMVFATAVAFYALEVYGNITLPLFLALVISYIFKDRIKEFARLYLSRKLRRFLFDHKLTIFSGQRNKIGIFEESFNFVKESRVAEQVRKIRDRDHFTEIANDWVGEKVILYRKHVELFPKKLKLEYQDFNPEGINDITRFNIIRFLGKMDDPRKTIFTAGDNSYRKASGERVYHLNMIIRYSMDHKSMYKRFRIVLSRAGIKRIEQIYPVPIKSAKLEPVEQDRLA